MRIEGSSISCGVRRLVIEKNERPTKDQLSDLIKSNKGGCAVVVTGVPSRRRDITTLLLDNEFEHVKNPNKIIVETPSDESVKPAFTDMAFLIMHHDHEAEDIDDAVRFEQFVQSTIKDDLIEMAATMLHHGNPPTGNLNVYIRYMNK